MGRNIKIIIFVFLVLEVLGYAEHKSLDEIQEDVSKVIIVLLLILKIR